MPERKLATDMRLSSTSTYILSPADVVGQGEALEWRDLEVPFSRHADCVEWKHRVTFQDLLHTVYKPRGEKGKMQPARQISIGLSLCKKWFWAIVFL